MSEVRYEPQRFDTQCQNCVLYVIKDRFHNNAQSPVGLEAILFLVWVPWLLIFNASFITWKVTGGLQHLESSKDAVPVPLPSAVVL